MVISSWQRLGENVRRKRIDLGYSNRDAFAEASRVSVRVIADLESGKRSNFSDRVIARLEASLHWPSGTMGRIVSDADFAPPEREIADPFWFRPPVFDRRQVSVDVCAVEGAIAALAEVSRGKAAGAPVSAAGISTAAVALCWPYVLRLVEDNCLPGSEPHPAVRPLYSAFIALAQEFVPSCPSQRYAQWLAGQANEDLPEITRRSYARRWQESQRGKPGHRD